MWHLAENSMKIASLVPENHVIEELMKQRSFSHLLGYTSKSNFTRSDLLCWSYHIWDLRRQVKKVWTCTPCTYVVSVCSVGLNLCVSFNTAVTQTKVGKRVTFPNFSVFFYYSLSFFLNLILQLGSLPTPEDPDYATDSIQLVINANLKFYRDFLQAENCSQFDFTIQLLSHLKFPPTYKSILVSR